MKCNYYTKWHERNFLSVYAAFIVRCLIIISNKTSEVESDGKVVNTLPSGRKFYFEYKKTRQFTILRGTTLAKNNNK